MLTSVGVAIKGMANPAFLLLSSSAVSLLQVIFYRKDLTGALFLTTLALFGIMTALGLIKHIKTGEAKGEIFLKKTIEQLVVMISVISLGHIASVFIAVIFKVVTQAQPDTSLDTGTSIYVLLSGYAVMFTYYFIKCCDLIDQILPNVLPSYFSAPFRKFRKTGDYKDLLSFASEPEHKEMSGENAKATD